MSDEYNQDEIVRRESDKRMHERLGNIEGELREMRHAIVTLARVEERMANYSAADARLETQLGSLFARLNDLEKVTAHNNHSLSTWERGWWMCFAALCSAAVGFLMKRFG